MNNNQKRLAEIKLMEEEMEEQSKPDNPYVFLGNLKEHGYDLRETLKQTYLFNQPSLFGLENGFIPEGIVSLLVSPGGCGKTFALMQCAVAAATGTKWLDTFSPNGTFKTLLILAEENRVFAHNRLKNIVHGLGFINKPDLMDKIYENIHMLPMSGQMQRLTDDKGNTTQNYEYLKKYLQNNSQIKLVILDPASRFLGPECEVSNAAATDWVSALAGLTQIGGKPTIIVSHHANKTAIRPVSAGKDVAFDQSITRGSSGLVDGVRLVLGMQRQEAKDQKTTVMFKILKSNVCEIGESINLEINRNYAGVLIKNIKQENNIDTNNKQIKKNEEDKFNFFSPGVA